MKMIMLLCLLTSANAQIYTNFPWVIPEPKPIQEPALAITWHEDPINVRTNMIDRQLGYRSDGVVVWRSVIRPPAVQYIATNLLATNFTVVTNYISTMVVTTPTNIINRLVESGEICRVRGHAWRDHLHVTLEYVAGRAGCRECGLCRLHQNQITEWK